jgi:superfamily II DNA or RNA helicase
VGFGGATAQLVSRAEQLHAVLARPRTVSAEKEELARAAIAAMRDGVALRQIQSMPVARLKETTEGRVRLGLLEAAGYRTVASVLAAGPSRLQMIDGVGPQTAQQAVAAARRLAVTLTENARLRFDPDSRPPEDLRTLKALFGVEVARAMVDPLVSDAEPLAQELARVIATSKPAASRIRSFFAGRTKREALRRSVDLLDETVGRSQPVAQRVRDVLDRAERTVHSDGAQWADYLERPIVYNGLLIEVGGLAPAEDAAQGYLPTEIIAAVQRQPLDTGLLRVSLRGYQAFGAKFALVQKRAILGDEMGLGKTIEALAVICHLHANDRRYALVVCPASVLVNWMHEVRRHSDLQAWRIHGSDRAAALQAWVQRGGVAITTFDGAKSLRIPDGVPLDVLVVDEAHYVKNPRAGRTRTIVGLVERAERALYMSGTPMENRVEEFKVLAGQLQPAVAGRIDSGLGLLGAATFRATVAPVYLRRNQDDVLSELPPRLEMQAWVDLEGEDLSAYRSAVLAGEFMRMRRAAYEPGTAAGSAKLARLVDIVEEAATSGQKVVIFSFFRDVLDTINSLLGSLAMGPLTGSVAPARRQELVDQFTARSGPAVLVSQIEAGGVGLNIQAASVVILAEPQWKPSTEEQAIARCHRMGQVRRVEVHRLLAEESVDERMLEILATKGQLFDEYVRRSSVRDASPDAVDVSSIPKTEEVVSQAEAERRIIEMEQRRFAAAGGAPF